MQSLRISICSIDISFYIDSLHILLLHSLQSLYASTCAIDSHVFKHIFNNLVLALNTANKTFNYEFLSPVIHKRSFHFCHVVHSHFKFGCHPQIIPVITSHRPFLLFCLSHHSSLIGTFKYSPILYIVQTFQISSSPYVDPLNIPVV